MISSSSSSSAASYAINPRHADCGFPRNPEDQEAAATGEAGGGEGGGVSLVTVDPMCGLSSCVQQHQRQPWHLNLRLSSKARRLGCPSQTRRAKDTYT
ncbi:hypothetical protein TKK_0005113 [Trichogramma kaykai]